VLSTAHGALVIHSWRPLFKKLGKSGREKGHTALLRGPSQNTLCTPLNEVEWHLAGGDDLDGALKERSTIDLYMTVADEQALKEVLSQRCSDFSTSGLPMDDPDRATGFLERSSLGGGKRGSAQPDTHDLSVCLRLYRMKHSLTKERETSSAVHRAFDELEFRHMPFDHAIVDWPSQTSLYCVFVLFHPRNK